LQVDAAGLNQRGPVRKKLDIDRGLPRNSRVFSFQSFEAGQGL